MRAGCIVALDQSQKGLHRSQYGIERASLHCRRTAHGYPAAGALGLPFGRAGRSAFALIYGPVARGTEGAGSDVDLLDFAESA